MRKQPIGCFFYKSKHENKLIIDQFVNDDAEYHLKKLKKKED